MPITLQQLADASRNHLDLDPDATQSVQIDRDRVMEVTPPPRPLTPAQAVGFLEALGLDPDGVVEVKADVRSVQLVRMRVEDGEQTYRTEVINVENARTNEPART